MQLADKKIVVIGAGVTGREVARFVAGQGARILVSDNAEIDLDKKSEIEAIAQVAGVSIETEFGGHTAEKVDDADYVIPSPGVPRNSPMILRALDKKIPVLGEMELAARFIKAPIIAVTGTNGKSTTVSLIGKMIESGRLPCWVGGNLGSPLIEVAGSDDDYRWLVVEVSSYQLEWIDEFKANIAVLLNLTEDHLERYDSFDQYYEYKTKIFRRRPRLAVYNLDDRQIAGSLGRAFAMDKIAEAICPFSSSGVRPVTGPACWYENGQLHYLTAARNVESYGLTDYRLVGIQNVENAAAAIPAARYSGVGRDAISKALAEFEGLPHRIEPIGPISGVMFYNDSKGTNIGAMLKALEAFEKPVVLIAGGKDKGGDLKGAAPMIKSRVKRLVLIGEAADRMQAAWADATEINRAADLNEAVRIAADAADEGGTVLFSPGCSSFDMFGNYKLRGEAFRLAVEQL